MSAEDRKKINPRVVFFAGKAAPGYYIAKLTIRLIVNVARVINADPETSQYLQMYFLPDYSVSLAEVFGGAYAGSEPRTRSCGVVRAMMMVAGSACSASPVRLRGMRQNSRSKTEANLLRGVLTGWPVASVAAALFPGFSLSNTMLV